MLRGRCGRTRRNLRCLQATRLPDFDWPASIGFGVRSFVTRFLWLDPRTCGRVSGRPNHRMNYPYGPQAHGGFDCSGFVWNVLHTKTPNWRPKGRPYKGWPLAERSSSAMAAATHNRVPYAKLKPGGILFFTPSGRRAKATDVYHAAIYLGRGWMIHSSGSRAGVSIDAVSAGSWWHDDFAWGRRLITG
jgi:cell wall-associated NlpC family hydrolase